MLDGCPQGLPRLFIRIQFGRRGFPKKKRSCRLNWCKLKLKFLFLSLEKHGPFTINIHLLVSKIILSNCHFLLMNSIWCYPPKIQRLALSDFEPILKIFINSTKAKNMVKWLLTDYDSVTCLNSLIADDCKRWYQIAIITSSQSQKAWSLTCTFVSL